MIRHIRIQNYRSLVDVDVTLDPLTVLIGRSGTGKSNFVRAIRDLRDALLAQSIERLGAANLPFGSQPVSMAYTVGLKIPSYGDMEYVLIITPKYGIEEKLSRNDQVVFHQSGSTWVVEPAIQPRMPAGSLCLGRLTGIRASTVAYVALTSGIACYDFPGSVLQQPNPLEAAASYQGQGDHYLVTAGRIIDAIDRLEDWDAVAKSVRAVNTRVRSVELKMPERDRLKIGYDIGPANTLVVSVGVESEGFRRYLAHLLALYQNPPRQTMLFEHPEIGIHPGAMEALADEFEAHVADGRGQVVLTTHSPQLLDRFKPENLRVVTMDGMQTRIGPLAEDQVQNVRDGLMTAGELLTVDPARIDKPAAAGV